MFIGVNLELSSLVLRNKSHPSCRRLYKTFPTIHMHKLHGQNYFIKHMYNDKFLCIMQLFSQYNTHPYLRETFQMPSISTMTSLRFCTNPICQQRGFILDKQKWRVLQHHGILTHRMHISIIIWIRNDDVMNEEYDKQKAQEGVYPQNE